MTNNWSRILHRVAFGLERRFVACLALLLAFSAPNIAQSWSDNQPVGYELGASCENESAPSSTGNDFVGCDPRRAGPLRLLGPFTPAESYGVRATGDQPRPSGSGPSIPVPFPASVPFPPVEDTAP